MNYYEARQRQRDQQWDYTCRNDGRVWPVGYCAGWQELDETGLRLKLAVRYRGADKDIAPHVRELIDGEVEQCKTDQERRRPFRAKHHTDGHATPEEACECYRQYLLDLRLWLDVALGDWSGCVVCDAPTKHAAEIRPMHGYWPLCDAHRSREQVEQLLPMVGQIISSC